VVAAAAAVRFLPLLPLVGGGGGGGGARQLQAVAAEAEEQPLRLRPAVEAGVLG
jgi:hypothetical protein